MYALLDVLSNPHGPRSDCGDSRRRPAPQSRDRRLDPRVGGSLCAGRRLDHLRSDQPQRRRLQLDPVAVARDIRQVMPVSGNFIGSTDAFLGMGGGGVCHVIGAADLVCGEPLRGSRVHRRHPNESAERQNAAAASPLLRAKRKYANCAIRGGLPCRAFCRRHIGLRNAIRGHLFVLVAR